MIANARRLRTNATDWERRLWRHLRELNQRGFHFRRQVPFRNYILDFAEHRARLVIELDGSQHARRKEQDERRDALLVSEGYRVLRFWNADLTENLEGVLDAIGRALGK